MGHEQSARGRLAGTGAVILLVAAGLSPAVQAKSDKGLSPAAVKNAVRPYMQAIRACVERQREIQAPAGESLDLSFTIGTRGRVRSVRLLTAEHAGTYLAGCAAGVIRSVEFPAFSGEPVVVPRFPVKLQAGAPAPFPPGGGIDEDEATDKPPAAPRKVRAKILRKLRGAVPAIRACVREARPQDEVPLKRKHRRRRRRRARRKPRRLQLVISFVVNPLGRASDIEIATPAHRTDHAAGCVAGVLSFVEFPPQHSESYTLSRVKLPPL